MQMKALFIGQSYIDITFVTDHMPSGDEKTVARDYAVSFGGNAVTMGAKGLLWYDESDAERFLPALDVPDRLVIDTNGAGDIFHGSYVYSYLIEAALQVRARGVGAFDPASRQRGEPADARADQRDRSAVRRAAADAGRARSRPRAGQAPDQARDPAPLRRGAGP